MLRCEQKQSRRRAQKQRQKCEQKQRQKCTKKNRQRHEQKNKNERGQTSGASIVATQRIVLAAFLIIGAVSLICLLDPVLAPLMSEKSTDKELAVSWSALLSEEEVPDQRREVPDGFYDEVLVLDTYSDIQVSPDGSVIGFFSLKNKEMLFLECAQSLEEKGWVKVESGSDFMASFVKEEGIYTWLYLECSWVGAETAAIIQIG